MFVQVCLFVFHLFSLLSLCYLSFSLSSSVCFHALLSVRCVCVPDSDVCVWIDYMCVYVFSICIVFSLIPLSLFVVYMHCCSLSSFHSSPTYQLIIFDNGANDSWVCVGQIRVHCSICTQMRVSVWLCV